MRLPTLFNRLSLNLKLNALVIAVFVILILVLSLLASSIVRGLILDYGALQLEEEASLLQSHFSDQEQSIINAGRFLAFAPGLVAAVEAGNTNQIRTALLLQAESLNLDAIYIANRDGENLLTIADADVARNPEREAEFTNFGLIGSESVGLIADENPENGVLLSFVAPLRNNAGQNVGAIIAARHIDTAFMDELNFERDETHVGFVYEGELVAVDSSEPGEFETTEDDAAFIEQAQRGQVYISDGLHLDENGTPDLVSYSPVTIGGEIQGVLAIRSELGPLFAFESQLIGAIQLASVVIVVLSVIGLLLFVRYSIVNPITKLTRVTEYITSGDLTQRAPMQSQDEIGQLGKSFNTMTERMTNLLTDLETRNEQTEAARQQAVRSDQVKSAFLASMSHELRTPLNAVINFSRFVVDGDMGPVNEEQAEMLNEVIGSAKHLLNLINDVLDMSKIESGSLNLFVEDNIDITELLKKAALTGQGLLTEKPVTLDLNESGILPRIRGDRQRIYQIMLNLISNACKFTERGKIEIEAYHSKGEIIIAVADTGPGIALEDQPLIFEAFKQTKTGLRQGGGTGLGVPISKNLVEAHGGRLWLESQPGKGATFYFALPVKSDKLVPAFV